jgi:gliding motility-associated-like protein
VFNDSNVITPNGDGLNDRFHIAGLLGEGWNLEVYNRWGEPVYHTANYRQEWGEQVPPGLYYYVLQQEATNARYKGWVEAMR